LATVTEATLALKCWCGLWAAETRHRWKHSKCCS